jgi:acetolactate synthase I/III small subunit
MNERHTIIVLSENTPGVLQRVTTVFTRRRVNIESLTVSETEHHERSRFTVTFIASREAAVKILKPIHRFVEVIDATLCSDNDIVYREIAFFRVGFSGETEREHLWNLARNHHAEIANLNGRSLIIEKSGTEAEINEFKNLLPENSLLSFVRSGRIAIEKRLENKISVEKQTSNHITTTTGEIPWQASALET